MKKKIGYVITAGHLDIEWYQPLRSYRFWTVEALEDLRAAAAREDFKTYVLDGQMFPLLEYLDVMPEREAEARAWIASGKLAIGPFFTQFDEWLPSAESIIRNCLFGKRTARSFGGWMRAGYLPDNFGHPRQLPQILQNFGIDSLMFMRGMPEVPGDHPDEFLYRGLDGSTVLASHFRESYAGAFDIFEKDIDPIQPRELPYYPDYLSFEWHKELAVHDDPRRIAASMIENARAISHRYGSGVIPLIAGFDHLPPQLGVGESVRVANEMQDEIEFVMGDAQGYAELARERLQDAPVYDMELIGSKYQYVLLGALSTRTYLKRQNFGCEALLERYAEPLVAVASLLGYEDKPTLLREAWQNLLINSAHDSIHGSSVDEVHVEMEARFGAARQIASGVIIDALAFIGRHVSRTSGRDVLGYAPVGGPMQPHAVWLPIDHEPVMVCDAAGRPLPTQVLAREPVDLNGIGLPRNDQFPNPLYRRVLFLADREAGSLARFFVVPGEVSDPQPMAGGDDFIENEFLRVTARGPLISILDKATGALYPHLNLVEDDADAGDAWDFSPPWIPGELVRSSQFPFESRLVELGPVRAALELTGAMSVPARLNGDERSRGRSEIPLRFLVTLYRGTRRADVRLTLENTARDHRMRLRVPMCVKADSILSQGHLAILDRPIARQAEIGPWLQPPTRLVPCREWIAADDGKRGLAVALKGLYDYEAEKDPLTGQPDCHITLLRSVGMMGRRNTIMRMGGASDAHNTPGAQCLREHVIEWAYAPYDPSPDDRAPFLGTVQAFLYPPAAHAIRSEVEDGHADNLPPAFGWDEKNLQFSAFKRSYEGDAHILRFFENQGVAVDAEIRTPGFTKAWRSDMDERPLDELHLAGGRVTVHVEPYKAVTLRLEK